jgi:hypothetical protein
MFAVVASSAVTARVKAPVQARSASTPKASLVTQTTSAPAPATAQLAKKAQVGPKTLNPQTLNPRP